MRRQNARAPGLEEGTDGNRRKRRRGPGGRAPPLLPRPGDVPLEEAFRPADLRPDARSSRKRRRRSPPTRASTTASWRRVSSGASASARPASRSGCSSSICVIVAGVFGAATANRKILWVQALPGAIALALTLLARSSEDLPWTSPSPSHAGGSPVSSGSESRRRLCAPSPLRGGAAGTGGRLTASTTSSA